MIRNKLKRSLRECFRLSCLKELNLDFAVAINNRNFKKNISNKIIIEDINIALKKLSEISKS